GGGLQRSLALQRADDLRHDRQDLPHHFVHVLLGELAAKLAELVLGAVAERRRRVLRLHEDLRQQRHQLAHHVAHVLLRELALAPADSRRTERLAERLAELAERLAVGGQAMAGPRTVSLTVSLTVALAGQRILRPQERVLWNGLSCAVCCMSYKVIIDSPYAR